MNYAMIDENNIVFNIAVWDGQTEWNPGCSVFLIRENEICAIGYTLVQTENDYSFAEPEEPEQP